MTEKKEIAMKHTAIILVLASVMVGCARRGPVPPAPARKASQPAVDPQHSESVNLANASELDMVERVVEYRTKYRQALEALKKYYLHAGNWRRYKLAERELKGLNMVEKYHYMVNPYLAGKGRKPSKSIPEADELYRDAMTYVEGSFFGLSKDKLRVALDKLNLLLRQYPDSDKIDDAAYQAGQIYRKHFHDYVRAVQYYEKTWQWEENTYYPARYWAAWCYDFKLADKPKAINLYKSAIAHRTGCEKNVDAAKKRLEALTGN